ncbi:MAG: hypothetical protein D6723_06450 [Acidobacteria bacterium]|nr:MAG: hypothetical protein D6723_06450 [Acidobacteriota bacterium]
MLFWASLFFISTAIIHSAISVPNVAPPMRRGSIASNAPVEREDRDLQAIPSPSRLLILALIMIVFQHLPPSSSTVSSLRCSHIVEFTSVMMHPVTTFYIARGRLALAVRFDWRNGRSMRADIGLRD